MKPRTLAASVVALGLVCSVAATTPAKADPAAAKCVKAWGQVVYGAMGYNHLVHLKNTCAAAAECKVATNVNPEPQMAVVPGRSEAVVTTWLGSPAREFTPYVECRMR